MTGEDKKSLGRQLSAARKGNAYTQAAFAQLLGVSRPHLSSYENGRVELPFEILLKAAQALDAEFVVAGYKLTKERMQPGRKSAPPIEKQLIFSFDQNRVLRRASIQLATFGSRVVIRTSVAGTRK